MPIRTDRVPKQVYNVIIKETKFGPSSKGADMITAQGEIIAPEMVDFGGDQYKTAGREFTSYFSFSDKALPSSLQILEKFGVTIAAGESLKAFGERAAEELKNLTFNTVVTGSEIIARQDLTPADIAAGKKPWDAEPILHEGQPIVTGFKTEAEIRGTTIFGPIVHM